MDTLRIATYNILNFPLSTYEPRLPYFRTVLHTIDPDILVLQEMKSSIGMSFFLHDILNYDGTSDYDAAPFINGPDTDNALFYKNDILTLVSNRQISTSLRDISEYVLEYLGSTLRPQFWVYSAHLKAGTGTENEERRLAEATRLRNELNNLPSGSTFFVAGDFNLYSASEQAFTTLTGSQADNDGRCFDPLDRIGNWHNAAYYSDVHSQSTRTTVFDGGASGGLDDRFDFIFLSKALFQVNTFQYIDRSYITFGNDGQHLNLCVNTGTNYAVPDSIADALYYASDHLPIYLDFTVLRSITSVESEAQSPMKNYALKQSYPNPFNNSTTINFYLPKRTRVTLTIYNIQGEVIEILCDQLLTEGDHSLQWIATNMPSGVYFIKMRADEFMAVTKCIILK